MNLKEKKMVVLGLGISGMEVVSFLHQRKADITVRDSGDNKRLRRCKEMLEPKGISVELGDAVGPSVDFDWGILSPGIPPGVPMVQVLRQANVPLISELELAYRFCECPLIAVTGTNGKTTTTELIAAALLSGGKRVEASGNIGRAFSSVVEKSRSLDAIILEVSSFQLEGILDFRPAISVFLNLTPDHLDRHGSMANYQAAKWNIFKNQTSEDKAIVHADLELPARLQSRVITFGANHPSADYQQKQGTLYAYGNPVFQQKESKLEGEHQAENLLAALAVADSLGLDRETTLAAFRAYKPLPHRNEFVAEIQGVRYFNDSKATNMDALAQALYSKQNPIVLIAGGKDKGLDGAELKSLLAKKCKCVLLLGETALRLKQTWEGTLPCYLVQGDMQEAVELASQQALPGDVVLLSPGCASQDMFRDYEERGNIFRKAVEKKKKSFLNKAINPLRK